MESVQFEAKTRAISIGKSCRSLRRGHAAVSGISVPSERNLHAKEIIVDDAYNEIITDLLADLFNNRLPADGEISEDEINDLIHISYFGEPAGKNRDISLDAQYWIHDYVMYGLYLGDKAKFKFSPNGDMARGVRQTGDKSGYLIVVNYNNQGVDHPIFFQITAVSADSIFVHGGVTGNYIDKEMDANSAIQLLLNY